MRVDYITQLQNSVIPQKAKFLRQYQAKTANKDKSNGNPGLGKGTREVSFGFWRAIFTKKKLLDVARGNSRGNIK